jgi:hypothetical protein
LDSQFFNPLNNSAFDSDDAWQIAPDGDRSGPQATGPRVGLKTTLTSNPEGPPSPNYYFTDYRTDFPMGDNPYRYYRW